MSNGARHFKDLNKNDISNDLTRDLNLELELAYAYGHSFTAGEEDRGLADCSSHGVLLSIQKADRKSVV